VEDTWLEDNKDWDDTELFLDKSDANLFQPAVDFPTITKDNWFKASQILKQCKVTRAEHYTRTPPNTSASVDTFFYRYTYDTDTKTFEEAPYLPKLKPLTKKRLMGNIHVMDAFAGCGGLSYGLGFNRDITIGIVTLM
jgi:hypothetical protein